MIKEHPAMKEIHEIIEKIYEEEKGLNKKELIKKIHTSSEKLIKEFNLHLNSINEILTSKV